MAEVRHKLTDKQYTLYTEARRGAAEKQAVAEAARQQLAVTAELILDFYKVDAQSRVTVDDATKELVVTVDAPPATEAPPAPAKPKRSRKANAPAPEPAPAA